MEDWLFFQEYLAGFSQLPEMVLAHGLDFQELVEEIKSPWEILPQSEMVDLPMAETMRLPENHWLTPQSKAGAETLEYQPQSYKNVANTAARDRAYDSISELQAAAEVLIPDDLEREMLGDIAQEQENVTEITPALTYKPVNREEQETQKMANVKAAQIEGGVASKLQQVTAAPQLDFAEIYQQLEAQLRLEMFGACGGFIS